jgi:hypothetical protein
MIVEHHGGVDMIITVRDLAAEALFVSDLQPSEQPTPRATQDAVTATLLRHGSDGCAAAVAAEFGDHPESAVRRMTWARDQVARVAEARHPAELGGGPTAEKLSVLT